MPKSNTSLGIDVSHDSISLALLKQIGNSVELLKAAHGPIPENAVKDGNIQDPSALAKAIKKLVSQNRMRAKHAAISLTANPVLMQILDLPPRAVRNVGEFVRAEIKHCAILPGADIAMDFCGIQASTGTVGRRALVVAAENLRLADTVRKLNIAGLNIEAIEPASVAYIRAAYQKTLEQNPDRNPIFVLIHNEAITFSLFRKGLLDLVRVKRPEPGICGKCTLQSEICRACVVDEIAAILQYYQLEDSGQTQKWQVLFTAPENLENSAEYIEALKKSIPTAEVTLSTPQQAYINTPVADTDQEEKPSAIAVGLAMKLLDLPTQNLNINLIPPSEAQAKSAIKNALAIATIAATVFLAIIVSVVLLSIKEKEIEQTNREKQHLKLAQETQILLKQKQWTETSIAEIYENIEIINTVLNDRPCFNWASILGDISSATPQNVRLEQLSRHPGSSTMQLKGQALSSEDVMRFVNELNTRKHIASASRGLTRIIQESRGIIEYSINCTLAQ